jgi:hypothetical protein
MIALLFCSFYPLTTAAMATHIRHEISLEFTIVANPKEHRVDYTIYDMAAVEPVLWPRAGGIDGFDNTNSLEDAEVYLHGEVKWDGCSNWHFDEQDRVMLHGCSKSNVQRFGDVMALCWEWTAELCPDWAGDA